MLQNKADIYTFIWLHVEHPDFIYIYALDEEMRKGS